MNALLKITGDRIKESSFIPYLSSHSLVSSFLWHTFSLFSTQQVFNEANRCSHVFASFAFIEIAKESGSVVWNVLHWLECEIIGITGMAASIVECMW